MTPLALSTFLLGLIVIVAVAAFVAGPLFGGPEADTSAGPGEREHLEWQKRTALAAIRDIELDHQMGKLSDEDLQTQRARFEAQAMEAIAALEPSGPPRREGRR